ncbi:MAG TPA: alpha/beta hydrolase [Streptosporangiaceae bacterium]|nr:alpha/beta hydrolase [Streptosporangiaceae bacterium]
MTAFANQAELQTAGVKEFGDRRLRAGGGSLALFSSVPLDRVPPETSEAVVIVHGALRNAGDYYRVIVAADPGARHRVVVAPQFLTEADLRTGPRGSDLLSWGTEEWKGGLGRVSSFAVLDELLGVLGDVPGLRRITLAGNSAGGQLVNRYAAVGRGPDTVPVPVRFVVANPSTYLYFDRTRPTPSGFAAHDDPRVDEWRYGFGGKPPGYVRESPDEYFERYIDRDVTYLLGAEDRDPGAVLLEVHPAALAQGRTRRERGERYHEYLRRRAGRPIHRLVLIEGVGHDASAVFTSAAGRECLFGGPPPG